MAYIGSTPTSQNFISGTDYFSGTGSQTAFTLTRTVNSVNDIEVVINNVVQQPSTAYALSGTTITFTSAPSSGTNNIYVRYLATTMQSFTVPANSITRNSLDSNLQAGFQGRNRIINGAMTISQRGTSFSFTNGTTSTYTLDRWRCDDQVDANFTISQSSDAPAGFVNSLLVTTTSGDSLITGSQYSIVQQQIEANNINDLNWGTANAKTVTLSFWVKSSLTGTFGGSVRDKDATYTFPFSYVISAANTWTYCSVTITGPTSGSFSGTNGLAATVFFSLGTATAIAAPANAWIAGNYLTSTAAGTTGVAGTTGATWAITGVQLEEGTTATSFERESYSVTLQKCQRYYETIVCGSGTPNNFFLSGVLTGGNCTHTCYYKVTKRAAPSFSLIGGGVWTNTPGNTNIGVDAAVFQNTTSGYFYAGNGAGTGAAFNSEL